MANVQAFGVRAENAIANLQGKIPIATDTWRDLLGPVHAKHFTIAGAPIDVVNDIHAAMTEAITSGMTISQFRKTFDETVLRNGWSYHGSRGWRTSLIFNTNMHSAYSAGRWKQIWENRDKRPYLEYRAVRDTKTRPQHAAWNRIILPVDHPFWRTFYPPNGWNCRCTVRTYTKAELDAAGLKVSVDPNIQRRDVVMSDGEVIDNVPIGIDPGWDHNVGISWLEPEISLGRKLATLPMELQPTAIRQSITPEYRQVLSERWQEFYAAARQDGMPRGAAQIVGYLPDGVTMGLAQVAPDVKLASITVGVFDRRTLHLEGAHKAARSAQQVWPANWINRLPELMGDYRAVLWDSKNKTLIVIPKGAFNETVPKIALRPNTKYGSERVVSVVSLGSSQLNNLKQPEYVLVAGSLD